ncbi:S1 family peptidase [Kordiimonas laminariae]|uniref:S1 family peptidase n=1 Tax=Kordiimonas laminariae TaxID=2917717 RepID=UPI001FF45019|nr:serine protease [Kordiimonas laminariae]MCK0070163.1 serine protease [Kordiimonas laminariae]
MRRKFELAIYFVVIVFFIFRYAGSEGDIERRPEFDPKPVIEPRPDYGSKPVVNLPLPTDVASAVRVELEEKTTNGVGTAFAVDGNGTYVTARHVVDGCAEVFFIDEKNRLYPVKSAFSLKTRDFAIIKAVKGPAVHFDLTDSVPKRGQEGFMMGYPQGKPADVRAEVIGTTVMRSSGRYRMREPVVAWVERDRRPGFSGSLGGISGGPVFNEDGVVIGTVVAGSPRRGRVYTTNPHVFEETDLLDESHRGRIAKFEEGISYSNYDLIGRRLRAGRLISQVYCRAG